MSDFKDTAAVAIARLAAFRQPTAAEIQRGIDATMRDVVRKDARYNPQEVGGQPSTVTPAGAAPVVGGPSTGWRDYGPLQSPPGQDHIERIANALAGPVRGARPKAEEKKQ